ncbi:uncharacterized protein Bfra_011634 [Botrytis fragariae]|uniref:Uncharacterized protein n=1 Tax=Botrytis fragariae TaxID=1964551 RepID=A0A8H6AKP2_9HELO|nr:uncharacterized protein Bfra_011634 [Botrytis fragariae]KAF5869091.1 hypothetical protein Bfra_011634 [Botrytis fragariae]
MASFNASLSTGARRCIGSRQYISTRTSQRQYGTHTSRLSRSIAAAGMIPKIGFDIILEL